MVINSTNISKTKESLNSDGHQLYQYQQNKRKFKQWWSSIPPISAKRTITSHLYWTQKDNDKSHWKSRFWLGIGTQCGGVKLIKIKLSRLSHNYLVCSIYRLVYLYNIWRCITSEIDWSAISMNHLVVISQSNYTISFIKLLLTLVQLDPCFWLNYTVIYTLNSRLLH